MQWQSQVLPLSLRVLFEAVRGVASTRGISIQVQQRPVMMAGEQFANLVWEVGFRLQSEEKLAVGFPKLSTVADNPLQLEIVLRANLNAAVIPQGATQNLVNCIPADFAPQEEPSTGHFLSEGCSPASRHCCFLFERHLIPRRLPVAAAEPHRARFEAG
jgi:hypothetical protein